MGDPFRRLLLDTVQVVMDKHPGNDSLHELLRVATPDLPKDDIFEKEKRDKLLKAVKVKIHPDKHPGDERAHSLFQDVTPFFQKCVANLKYPQPPPKKKPESQSQSQPAARSASSASASNGVSTQQRTKVQVGLSPNKQQSTRSASSASAASGSNAGAAAGPASTARSASADAGIRVSGSAAARANQPSNKQQAPRRSASAVDDDSGIRVAGSTAAARSNNHHHQQQQQPSGHSRTASSGGNPPQHSRTASSGNPLNSKAGGSSGGNPPHQRTGSATTSSSSGDPASDEFDVRSKWPFLSMDQPAFPADNGIGISQDGLASLVAYQCINARGAIAHGKKTELFYSTDQVLKKPACVYDKFMLRGGVKAFEGVGAIKRELRNNGPVVSTSFKLTDAFAQRSEHSGAFVLSMVGKVHPVLICGWRLTAFGEMWLIQPLKRSPNEESVLVPISFGQFGIDKVCLAPKSSFEDIPWENGPYFDQDMSIAPKWRTWASLKITLTSAELEKMLEDCCGPEDGIISMHEKYSTFVIRDKRKPAHSRKCRLREVQWDKMQGRWIVSVAFV